MGRDYDIAEHTIRTMARLALERGEIFAFVRWVMRDWPANWQEKCLRLFEEEARRLDKTPEIADQQALKIKLSRKLVECEQLCHAHGLREFTRFTFVARDPRGQMVVIASTESPDTLAADFAAEEVPHAAPGESSST